ncbi:unnamed protein product [Toxocara canis]|uniref:F-box domain-containing protein n=1 Tax=Toxocara canis TaxID=6265 RepID=A0A183ULR5_TOXCA|nr:unnamed protein product [Toxocara canis]
MGEGSGSSTPTSRSSSNAPKSKLLENTWHNDLRDLENVRIGSLDVKDLIPFFKSIPPLPELISLIPHSPHVLDLMYSSVFRCKKVNSFQLTAYNAKQFFTQLHWWSAYVEKTRTLAVKSPVLSSTRSMIDICDRSQCLPALKSSSLLRIVRERVQSDRMLLVLFNKLNRAAPPGFEVADVDPAIPKLLVMFMNAYDKEGRLRTGLDVDRFPFNSAWKQFFDREHGTRWMFMHTALAVWLAHVNAISRRARLSLSFFRSSSCAPLSAYLRTVDNA